MVTINRHGIDEFCVANGNEALSILNRIQKNTDSDPDEIVRSVSFSGMSLRDSVVTYSAFMKREKGIDIVSYEERGKKRVPCQLALELKREVA